MPLTDRTGRFVPFFVERYKDVSIATSNYSPSEDTQTTDAQKTAARIYTDRGFLVRPWTEGLLYGITHRAYVDNGKSVTGLTPEKYYAMANAWVECPYVKIYAHNDGTYASAASELTVAPI